MMAGRIITFQFLLRDEPGVLSNILTLMAEQAVNLLTVNSNIPSNGCAVVTITAETSGILVSLEDLLSRLKETSGVIKAEVMAG